ncbi:MAG: cytochrome c [Candidatus Marinimicrobia bacterium]|nr:cytochrome c [Candidatus Neomarinimicrobiota bacterium]MCF7829934.1 cytochrome c [Candidatus Neomarinimicrobiota bacterium]MCF7879103.1 cytochrome c [Candidatus Neomarinimicrobiota bacterium]
MIKFLKNKKLTVSNSPVKQAVAVFAKFLSVLAVPFAFSSRGFAAKRVVVLAVLAVFLTGCFRGQPKKQPPIHPIPDMDTQPRYEAQGTSNFFADSMAMRQPVYGTVARGHLNDDDVFYRGMGADGQPIEHNPREVNMELLEHGQDQFNIYCSPCHSKVGDGRGIMLEYNYVPPASFHDERLQNVPDGHIFDVITNGIRNMPSYAHQIPPKDRWAIVAYVRALQRSQHAPLSDVPEEMQEKLK